MIVLSRRCAGNTQALHTCSLASTLPSAHHSQLVHLLKGKEVKAVSPSKAPVPRTFLLKPGQCLFLGGLARIDYVDGPSSAHFTVFAGTDVRIRACPVLVSDRVCRWRILQWSVCN